MSRATDGFSATTATVMRQASPGRGYTRPGPRGVRGLRRVDEPADGRGRRDQVRAGRGTPSGGSGGRW